MYLIRSPAEWAPARLEWAPASPEWAPARLEWAPASPEWAPASQNDALLTFAGTLAITMVSFVRRSLLAKLSLWLLATVVCGFVGLVVGTLRLQSTSVERMNRASASALARGLTAGVRSAMLSGNGIAVRQMLDEAKTGMKDVELHVYSPTGEEVFGPKPPPPPKDQQPAHVRAAIDSGKSVPADQGATALPIANEKRCTKCHADGVLRGVLTIGTQGARTPFEGDQRYTTISDIVRAAFIQIMTARHTDKLDDYFAELSGRSRGVKSIAIYDTELTLAFGDPKLALPRDVMDRSVKEGPAFLTTSGDMVVRVTPLKNEHRCQGCHGTDYPMRGALFVAFDPKALGAGDGSLLAASETSLQHVMLSGLGRLITGFLDQTAATGVVTTLTLHDSAGRLYHDALARPTPPAIVAAALASGDEQVSTLESGGRAQFVYVEPMRNEERCQRCHGGDLPLRGAITVALDRTEQIAEARKTRTLGSALAFGTVLSMFLALYLVLRATVLRPVLTLGTVADRVGEGKLDTRADIRSSDEIGRLGQRLNDMVSGLRQKLEMSKFVSQETVRTIESKGTVSRTGERKHVTVLFSDIRGFTSFSETREPEEVVAMLNEYLHAQAEVVLKYGGDIDKFVGDELMARFVGAESEARATRCGVEMIEAVEILNRKLPAEAKAISIGVGVNSGEVVLGAMGAEDRMDFTVIGDAVNLGARLCSAAEKGQVLVSGPARGAFGQLEGITLEPLEPIKVKGKAEAIPIFGAKRG
jgi:adenylate cyclase